MAEKMHGSKRKYMEEFYGDRFQEAEQDFIDKGNRKSKMVNLGGHWEM